MNLVVNSSGELLMEESIGNYISLQQISKLLRQVTQIFDFNQEIDLIESILPQLTLLIRAMQKASVK